MCRRMTENVCDGGRGEGGEPEVEGCVGEDGRLCGDPRDGERGEEERRPLEVGMVC